MATGFHHISSFPMKGKIMDKDRIRGTAQQVKAP